MKVIYLQNLIVLVAFGILYKCIHLYVLLFITTDSIKHRNYPDFSLRICLANSIAFVLYDGISYQIIHNFSFNSRSETLLILMHFGPIQLLS